jgi:hypothetical protein
MQCRIIFLSLAVLLPLAAFAQTPSAPPVSAPPAVATPAAPNPETSHEAKSYTPGIEQFMNVIQTEHAKLWYAASARNWELAAYQLGEVKEIMSDVEDLYPTFKNLPLGKMLDNVITGPIADAEKALDAKDFGKFSVAYGKLTDACNACHQATGNGFVVIQRPSGPAFPNQDFRPRK